MSSAKIIALSFITAIAFSACTSTKNTTRYPVWKSEAELTKTKTPIERLIGYYEGTFIYKTQKSAHIGNVRRIWPTQGYWLYAEQTSSESIEDVIDQSIVHLIPITRDSIIEEVYLLPEKKAESFRLAWYSPEGFDRIKISSLQKSPSCNTVWKPKQNDTFEGTIEQLCPFAEGNGVGKHTYITNSIVMKFDHISILTKFYDEKRNYTETVGDPTYKTGFYRVDPKSYYDTAAKIFAKRKK